MSLQEQIQKDIIVAMKAKDAGTLSTLRNLSAAIKNAIIDHNGEFTDADTQGIVTRQVKQLKDAMKDFEAGGRADLVSQNRKEISVIEVYLPQQISDDELHAIVADTIAETEAHGPSDMGKVMGSLMGKVQGKADGNRVKSAVMAVLK
ncbi:MAG: hypothetical protein COV60_02975 [Candidatus Magasanikbacteria bacterium CG11_big_fil_rev_8_21_14_0_20_43_7]|uniref:Aspartyl-tRNA amidotransferase n=1 Tax=Candidatus Magasanikbacteria bacterium CG11_big_fil_rev_8_21_14_0_20_43_7 TaxID=1974654 RepID=A0A2H0N231_9BACT|nr:MAG: hypothetical protein COV60_02975 [Candidatus Magasanikbacteria bacterium CG11_big_fil_rev_8_21_14_0_20_43_7]